MKWEYLNNGEPFPAGHRRAGQLGIVFDFEDGRPEPQNVYAATEREMLDKVALMYGNTAVRLTQVRNERTPAAPAAPIAASPEASAERAMQNVADLENPGRAGAAAVELIKAETGIDLREEAARRKAEDESKRMAGEVDAFMQANPEYFASRKNARLLRDRAFAIANGAPLTASHFQQSFEDLTEDGVFEADPSTEVVPPAATEVDEPLAPPPPRPRASTGARPSQFQTRPGALPTGKRLTAAEVEAMAGTDEYAYRLRHEPGFAAECDAALARG